MELPKNLDDRLTDEMRTVLTDIKGYGIDIDDVLYTALRMYLSYVRQRLIEVSNLLHEQQRSWVLRKQAAEKFLAEDRSRLYITPVTDAEAAEAKRIHKISQRRDDSAREKYGRHYMPNFHAWLDRLIEERGARCQRCGSESRKLTVHHRHNRTRGNETCADLALLCRRCHAEFHKRHRERRMDASDLVCIDRENEYWFNRLMGTQNMEHIVETSDEILQRKVDVKRVVETTITRSSDSLFC